MSLERRAFWVVLFGLAMAAAEAAVVVYLRDLFGTGASLFPVLDPGADARVARIGIVEMAREAATVLMLAGMAMLAGSTGWQRWAFFMLGFGAWDLLYSAWLYVFLGWPSSPMTWDVLFLIPVVWTGPVLAPSLVALCLVAAAWAVLALGERLTRAFRGIDWALEVVAGLTVILAFCANARDCFRLGEPELRFPWTIFSTGMILGVAVFLAAMRRGTRPD